MLVAVELRHFKLLSTSWTYKTEFQMRILMVREKVLAEFLPIIAKVSKSFRTRFRRRGLGALRNSNEFSVCKSAITFTLRVFDRETRDTVDLLNLAVKHWK